MKNKNVLLLTMFCFFVEMKADNVCFAINDVVQEMTQENLANEDSLTRTSVSGNVTMQNSLNVTIGNVTKGTNSFIHNFGTDNTFAGINSGNFTMFAQAAASNTGFGVNTLNQNNVGRRNTAVGYNALTANTDGLSNTAVGVNALLSNTTGNDNTAIGGGTLASNSTGNRNTGFGLGALNVNTANDNTAAGYFALGKNTTGTSNTALGMFALGNNVSSSDNTAVGNSALFMLTTGTQNIAIGGQALKSLTSGDYNIAIGSESLSAMVNGKGNTAVGDSAGKNLVAGINFSQAIGNTFIGFNAGISLTNGSNNIYIGNPGVPQEDGAIRIGNDNDSSDPNNSIRKCFIPSILNHQFTSGADLLAAGSNGLSTLVSSRRFKRNISDMKDGDSVRIYDLRPVVFTCKGDQTVKRQYGLIAEDVDMVLPNLVLKNHEKKPLSVCYAALSVLLLKEIQKQQQDIITQEDMMNDNEQRINTLMRMIEDLSVQVESHDFGR